MQSTPNLRDTDPHDVFVIEPDASLAARADKAPLDLLYDVLSRPSDPAPSQVRPDPELRIAPDFSASAAVPAVDTAARATVAAEVPVNDIKLGETEISAHRSPANKLARGAVMGLFALVSATGAAAWQHYGDDAKAMVAQYAPTFSLASLASLASTAKPATTEAAPAAQAAAADQVTAQPSALAPPAANAPAAMASVANEQAQQLQSMARDLAAMGQQISDLKATIEQLRTSQAQMTQAQAALTQAQVASAPKTTEARLTEPALTRPRIVPPPTHSTVTSLARRPKQTFPYAPIAPASPPQQAAGTAPVQTAPQPQIAEDGGPVVRPPMALH
jgi:TolA-binding protein